MKKWIKKVGALFACAVMIISSSATVSAEVGYTYNYDWWGDVQYSPDAYEVEGVYTAVELGLDKALNNPNGLFVKDNMVYICDTGNNRIIEMERSGNDIEVKRVIEEFKGAEVNTFAAPKDIAITDDGYMFIADQDNGRILKLTMDLEYVMEFVKPTDANFDQDISFLPKKIAVDTAGRVYCLATNVNKGLIKYEADGTFTGFVGATPVIYDWKQYIWKRIATKEQRAQMESFVPTEYDNLYMDYEGFIYVCTTNVSAEDVDSGDANPIRKLNLMGSDILIRNGEWPIAGDIYFGSGGGYEGTSLITDVTALENDTYAGLDKVRGRIFVYDDQGRIVFIFGGNGNMDGYFKQPTAIEHQGRDLMVLDGLDRSLTIFTPTEFGDLVYDAIEQFKDGDYEASGESWKQVMALNGNYDLAYIGIGRALLRQEEYKEAMEYFKLKWDEENYSKAFKQYRKQWIEENIGYIFALVALIILVPMAIGKVKALKHEIDTADIFRYKK